LVDRFDQDVDQAFDRLRGRKVPDRVFYGAAAIGDHSLVWFGLAALAGLRRDNGWQVARRAFAGILAESVIVNVVVKSFFGRSRPTWEEFDHPHPLRVPLTSSFPSGHASAAAVAFILLADRDDPLTPLYAASGAVVALSRVHVRIHHASDVVGGLVVGSALGLAIRRAFPLDR
jgi:undecaprenyl-diphosphatase